MSLEYYEQTERLKIYSVLILEAEYKHQKLHKKDLDNAENAYRSYTDSNIPYMHSDIHISAVIAGYVLQLKNTIETTIVQDIGKIQICRRKIRKKTGDEIFKCMNNLIKLKL